MDSHLTLGYHPISVVLLDVRGTVIDPVHDEPMNAALAQAIAFLGKAGCIISIITATSILSLQKLFLAPLLRECALKSVSDWLVLYVDSATAAYSISSHGEPVPLNGFEVLCFTSMELELINRALKVAGLAFPQLKPITKIKAGQVNFYCGGTWPQRRLVADFLNAEFRLSGLDRVLAMVPTAKETIDVAVSQKSRGAQDTLMRFGSPPQRMIVIGDSMQEGGPDLQMYRALPGSRGVQVGEQSAANDVVHVSGLPAPFPIPTAAVLWRNGKNQKT